MNRKFLKRILQLAIIVMVAASLIFVVSVILNGINKSFRSKDDKNPTAAPDVNPTGIAGDPTEAGEPETPDATQAQNTPEPTQEPQLITYKDVSMLAAGDVMVYESMWVSAKQYGGDRYDFSELTKYVSEIIKDADVAVFNLETNCAGEEIGYSAYPLFNSPDSIITTMKDAGFDVALFANNHTYDKGHRGLIRTQEILAQNNLKVIGARTSESAKSYGVFEFGGVRFGMMNFCYEDGPEDKMTDKTCKYLNWNRLDDQDIPLVDTFNRTRLDDFYTEAASRIAEMKAQGADLIVLFMHWGSEYEEAANSEQKTIAKKMCDLGVDVLVGGHSHTVEPTEKVVSSDGSRKMLCFYSLGNYTSAQNRATFKAGTEYAWLTENELMAKFVVRKYSTGETIVLNAQYYPCWMHRHTVDERLVFNVVPLEKALASDDSKARYGLLESSFGVDHATTAYKYIVNLVKSGIEDFNSSVVLPYEAGDPRLAPGY